MSIETYDARPALSSANRAAPNSKRSVVLLGKRTSVSLEDEFWAALRRMAAADGKPVSEFISGAPLDTRLNLSSALRVFILRHYERLAGLS